MSEHRAGDPQHTGVRRVRSLQELPQEMMPKRDLWPQIEARLTEAPQAQARTQTQRRTRTQTQTQTLEDQTPRAESPAALGPVASTRAYGARPGQPPWAGRRVQLAAAAVLLVLGVALTVGVWITHGSAIRDPVPPDLVAIDQSHPLLAPVDVRRNAALLRSLNARLEALPPPSRQKVLEDLTVIEHSMRDIQSALGRDPSNALLREMLLESYQDEQQLIATVQEAGVWTREAGTGKGSI